MGILSRIASLFRRRRLLAPAPRRSDYDVRGPLAVASGSRVWELGDQDAAMREAEQGNFRHIAELYDGMRGDGLIRGLLALRAGLPGLRPVIKGDPFVIDRLRGREAEYDEKTGVQVQCRIQGAMERVLPRAERTKIVACGIMAGAGIGYMDDDPRSGGWRRARALDLHFLSYVHNEDAFYYQDAKLGRLRVNEHDGRWLLYLPYGRHRPWAYGAWYPCSKPFITKYGAVIDRSRWSRFLADALRFIQMNEDASEQHLQDMVNFMRVGWQYTGGLVAPKGYTPGMVESTGKGYEVYCDTEDRGDKEIMIAIAGQVVTTEGGKGFSKGDIWQDIAASLVQETADTVSEWADEDIWSHWTRAMGLGPDRVSVGWDATPPASRLAAAEAAGVAAEGLAGLDEQAAKRGKRVRMEPYLRSQGVEVELEDIEGGSSDAPARPRAPFDGPAPAGQLPAPPEASPSETLAAAMTQHKIDRCAHGRPNRCPQCGVERVFAVQPGARGKPHSWPVAWRPIAAVQARADRAAGVVREVSGVRVLIERPRGSMRSGVGPDGAVWVQEMLCDYGEIVDTLAPDGDPVDAYVGPQSAGPVFVVLQVDQAGDFDEPKIMLGFESEDAAVGAYLAHGPPWGFGGIERIA